MMLFFVLFGIAAMLIFHNFGAVVYIAMWYTLITTILYFVDRNERR